jgi:lipopolysaccharide transport system ATP-binding protein
MTDFSLKAENLGKEYLIGGAEVRHDTFREMLTSAISSPLKKLKRLSGRDADQERFWALKDLNFEIQQGEKIGIIGHNGAGKSTLLKVLSRITPPTQGQIQIRGRVASLLEVGTGFHPELTGRENIFLNGSILGMPRAQIRKCFDEIVSFAEVEKFIDTPVKRYSSGMYVRLAFSVAAHLDSDVLIVDEVLAVGDKKFQDRSLGKLDDMGAQGRTVLFVSHNLSMVNQLCSRTMLLEQGELVTFDDTIETIKTYGEHRKNTRGSKEKGFTGPLLGALEVLSMTINGDTENYDVVLDPLNELRVELDVNNHKTLKEFRATLSLVYKGEVVVSQHSSHLAEMLEKGKHRFVFEFPSKMLSPGDYSCRLMLDDDATNQWIWGEHQGSIDVVETWAQDYQPKKYMGVINFLPTAKHERL